jgi:hypothetical protein
MPILRPPSSGQTSQGTVFQQSVASAPLAMSMMIESMVNMVQNNRSPFKEDSKSSAR